MDLENIVGVTTFVVALILGYFAKKSNFIKNEMIPIQNVIVGVLVALIEWIITKDFNEAIILSGLIASLLAQGYDCVNAAVTASLAHSFASEKVKNNFALTPQLLIEKISEL